jgi:hypothetical protein
MAGASCMKKINGVDFEKVTQTALDAAKIVLKKDYGAAEDILKNIADALTADVDFLAKKKLTGEFNEADARIYLEDQKMVARVRLRSLATVTLQTAEDAWNAVALVFRDAIKTALGWEVL